LEGKQNESHGKESILCYKKGNARNLIKAKKSHLVVSVADRRHTTQIIDSWKHEERRAMDYLASASLGDFAADDN
jgi:hypothetical protein